MKIPFRNIESFVKAPDPAAKAILVYGPDKGLVCERAKIMGRTVVKDLNDPFNAVTLSTDILQNDPARLVDEARSIPMMGGRRLIRVENAADKLTVLLKDYLTDPVDEALVILEAGELGPRSSLRKFCESAKNAAALPCYIEDERDVSRLIRETLTSEGLSAAPDAVSWLASAISGDRLKVRSELEKLVIYKGTADRTPVTLAEAQSCCGDAGAVALDDLVYAVAGRQTPKALKTYGQLLEDGVDFVVILRALQNHFRRLHVTKARIEAGDSLESAMKSLTPSVFFKQVPAFKAQLQQWRMHDLETVLGRLMALEAQCKQTGAPVKTLCAQAILGLSRFRAAA